MSDQAEAVAETATADPAPETSPSNEGRAETISDIQNYLASFNKEIQGASADQVDVPTSNDANTVYFVTPSSDGQFEANGGAFYTTSGFYTTTGEDADNGEVQQVTLVQGQDGLQQIVLATASDGPIVSSVEGGGIVSGQANGEQTGLVHVVTDGDQDVQTTAVRQVLTIPSASCQAALANATTVVVSSKPPADKSFKSPAVSPKKTRGRLVRPPPVILTAEAPTKELATSAAAVTPAKRGGRGRPPAATKTPASEARVMPRRGAKEKASASEGETPTATIITSDGQEIAVADSTALQFMASLQGTEAGNNQMVMNAPGGGQFQTVTILPNENEAGGEMSYVLYVTSGDEQQGDVAVTGASVANALATGDGFVDEDAEMEQIIMRRMKNEPQSTPLTTAPVTKRLLRINKEEMDMSIYDFEDADHKNILDSTDGDMESKDDLNTSSVNGTPTSKQSTRVVKVKPQKSQTVTQAHMCNYCNYTSPKRYLLSRHMKSHSEERPHKCSVCERGFKTLASLQNHVNTHTGTRPHKCKHCPSAFTTSGELVRHVRYKHTHEKPHKCTECDYASVELSKLKRHIRCHTGERPYQCPHCTYASPDTYKLKRHLRIHTGEKPYECDICHARFTQSNSLKAHRLIHTGNKPIFKCELCPTTCGRKTDLRIHVQKLHTSDKPLKCKRCGKSFPDRYTYKMHAKTHEGEKCYKCDLCSYASISQRHLESHMLIHTDQKPFTCDQCDQAFRQKQLLRRHKNLYHDPNYVPPAPREKTHECPECKRAFRHKGNLIRHMAIHDPDASVQDKEAALFAAQDEDEQDLFEAEEAAGVRVINQDGQTIVENGGQKLGVVGSGQQMTTADGQQVVVYEVIQLQDSDGNQTLAVLDNGEGGNEILGITEGTPAARQTTPGRTRRSTRMKQDLSAAKNSDISTVDASAIAASPATPVTPPKTRGRPKRKVQILEEEEEVKKVNNPAEDEEPEDYFDSAVSEAVANATSGPLAKRLKRESNVLTFNTLPKTVSEAVDALNKMNAAEAESIVNDAESAKKEAERRMKREEQKQQAIEECFGFNDDDDDDEEVDYESPTTVPVC